ncbi:MAG TPA: glycosyltransferase family 4 protein, partial [Ignavibacteriaceae bacterium]|nr:glycosyltransferase family 4 protein [Ignavibacteriaceae bacterium]
MRILLIAPHPFYQERGTPIAVKLLSETLCEFGHEVDILTYHEGTDFSLKGLRIFRIIKPFFIKNIPIGFSWKKVFADFYLTVLLIRLVIKNKYDVIHAVEESIFPAAFVNLFIKKKLIYDMDSSMADQLIERKESLKNFHKLLDGFEALAVKRADLVIPVCKYLADKVRSYDKNKKIFILEDIAFESNGISKEENIRQTFNLRGVIALYIGNLEHYQGIDLLLESVVKINSSVPFSIVIIGGNQTDILKYQAIAKDLNISNKVYFIGPRSFKELPYYLSQADILLSPRIKGKNTPMKLYSYLASGKPVLATRIDSHLQAIDDSTSKLADADPDSFALGLQELIENENMRNAIGEAGRILAKNNYSLDSYKFKLKKI